MSTGGFSFGLPTTTATGTATSGFSFGSPAFGASTNPTQPTATSNLFSPAPTSSTSVSTSLGFGLQPPKTTGFSIFGQNLGTTASPSIGSPFNIGQQTPATSTVNTTTPSVSTSGFSFGLSAAKPTSTTTNSTIAPLGLGGTSLTSTASSPFSFGLATTKPSFGTPSTQPAPSGFGLAPSTTTSTSQSTTTAQSPFTLGSTGSAGLKPFGTLPSFGLPLSTSSQPSQTSAQPVSTVQSSPFQLPTTSIGTIGGLSSAVTTVTGTTTGAPVQSSLATSTTQPTLPGLSFGLPSTTATSQATSAPSTTAFGFGLSSFSSTTSAAATTTTTTAPTLGLATTTSLALSSGIAVGLTSTTASTSAASVTPATTAVTSGAQSIATGTKPSTLTYNQLEDLINKWACDLEEQERYFLDEADRITQWDQALMNNGDKITTLYEKVESCKSEQTQIEQELDFIENQQKELENLLEPLERAANELPPGQLHSDFERDAIFQLATNVDLELGQLLSDLREMADQINTSTNRLGLTSDSGTAETGSKDSATKLLKSFNQSGDGSGAVQQLTRILNCHMHSLNWIHHNSQELMERLKLLEANQVP